MARKKKIEEKRTILTTKELLQIEQVHHRVSQKRIAIQEAKSFIELNALKIKLNEKDIRLLNSEVSLEKQRVQKLETDLIKIQEGHQEFLKELAKDLSIEGKWGFNPETGEIIIN